ncbi:MAG: DUF881 domain-containing protein [Eubacterium sp.]
MKCNKETAGNFLMVFLFVVVGVGMAIILKHFGSVNVPVQRTLINAKTLYDQELNADNLKIKNAELNKKIEIDSMRLQGYQEAESTINDENSVISTIDEYFQVELEKYKMANARIALKGPGIVITLSDSDKVIESGENPNKYLVHNSDILAIINELKAAGAEGIQINKIRLVSTSNIDCGGAVINIDDEISSPPFVIEAIGDPESMFIYLNSDESVIQMLKYWEIKVNIEKSDSLLLNKSNKVLIN